MACRISAVPQTLYEDVVTQFGSSVHHLVRLALEFQKMSGETIVSRDFSVVTMQADAIFDISVMTDEWEHPTKRKSRQIPADSVLCTTQLGLVRQERRDGNDEAGAGVTETILLKPKVVLTSMLGELQSAPVSAGNGWQGH